MQRRCICLQYKWCMKYKVWSSNFRLFGSVCTFNQLSRTFQRIGQCQMPNCMLAMYTYAPDGFLHMWSILIEHWLSYSQHQQREAWEDIAYKDCVFNCHTSHCIYLSVALLLFPMDSLHVMMQQCQREERELCHISPGVPSEGNLKKLHRPLHW